ncbi:MAG TPA: alpha/beta fold hydrolase [Pseudolabrys sp.]
MAANLHTVTSGPAQKPGAPALLLIHPLGSSHVFWDECAAIWSKRFHVVAMDLRGAGKSPIPDRNWKVDEHVRDVISVREAAGLRDVVVVGCAIGSMIAAPYAAADAAVVRGVVLTNTTTELGEASRARHEGRLALVREKGMEALLPQVIDMAFDGLPKDERYSRYMERFRSNNPQGYGSLALGMVGTNNTETLKKLDVPTLVAVGAHDTLLPPDLSRSVHALVKNSEFAMVNEGAHFMPYQAPETFAALVSDFIDRRVKF